MRADSHRRHTAMGNRFPPYSNGRMTRGRAGVVVWPKQVKVICTTQRSAIYVAQVVVAQDPTRGENNKYTYLLCGQFPIPQHFPVLIYLSKKP